MLLYSGTVQRTGEVHDGDTVMDFLPQERERGITIQSAAISFPWQRGDRGGSDAPFEVNLIDTPGHVDFTVEVERSLRVLDGAVALYDAVAGVQAQSETVWRQADRYAVPRIGFVNKMDRTGADYYAAARSIQDRLGAEPLLLHLPIADQDEFCGVVDLLRMQVVRCTGADGEVVERWPLDSAEAAALEAKVDFHQLPEAVTGGAQTLAGAAAAARARLAEQIGNFDDEVAEAYLLAEEEAEVDGGAGVEGLTAEDLVAALRRITLQPDCGAVALMCGSAYKNQGVQPLLDAVCDLLPSPLQAAPPAATPLSDLAGGQRRAAKKAAKKQRKGGKAEAVEAAAAAADLAGEEVVLSDPNGSLAAFVFKVVREPQRGDVAYLRVYRGTLREKVALLNARSLKQERAAKLLQVMGGEDKEVPAVPAGRIAAVTGLRGARTGDTLVLPKDPRAAVLPGLNIPAPVFTAALESGSPSEQRALEEALALLVRQDPSLHFAENEETGQLLLSGMGELHLEVAVDRLKREMKLPGVELSRMSVAYRETIASAGAATATFDRTIEGQRHWARVAVRVRPLTAAEAERLEVAPPPEGAGLANDHDAPPLAEDLASLVPGGGVVIEGALPRWAFRKVLDEPWAAGEVEAERPVGQGEGEGEELATEEGVLSVALQDAILSAVETATARGPAVDAPMLGLVVTVDTAGLELHPQLSSELAVRGAAAMAAKQALAAAHPAVLEPVMAAEVETPEEFVGRILTDLTGPRRALVREVGATGTSGGAVAGKSIVRASVPLREMVGYSTALRSASKGEATFHMELGGYQVVPTDLLDQVKKETMGF